MGRLAQSHAPVISGLTGAECLLPQPTWSERNHRGDMTRIDNDSASDARRRAYNLGLISLPVDLVVATVVSWAALSTALSQAIGVTIPWWALGPGFGLLLWAAGLAMVLSMNRSMNANNSPLCVDLTSEGMVALLPPPLGSRVKDPRELAVPWDRVEAVSSPGFFRPGMVRYHRGGSPTTTVGGTPQGEILVVTARTARQVEQAWHAWKARSPATASSTAPLE